MSDTLANQWRQRMAGRSALCAVLLAVPVAVAAQISFSAGLDNVPFGVSTLAAGPETSSIGPAGAAAPDQNLATPLDDAAAATATAAVTTGGGGPGTTLGGTDDVSGGVLPPGSGDGSQNTGDGDGGPGGTGPEPPSPAPTPTPTPVPTPPAPAPEPPAAPPVQPVPNVTVPDIGNVVDSVTDPVDQATGGLVGGGQ